MSASLSFLLRGFAAFTLALGSVAIAARAADGKSAPAAEPQRELAIVVVESLQHNHGSAITDFDRMDVAFREVVEKRKWPVKLVAERFAANIKPHETELRIFNQTIREEVPGELTFRAWMTLTDHGVKYDFKVVKYRYYRRLAEQTEDQLEKIFLGAANAAADKIEPILFPKPAEPKS
jgi:hypothetical protein